MWKALDDGREVICQSGKSAACHHPSSKVFQASPIAYPNVEMHSSH